MSIKAWFAAFVVLYLPPAALQAGGLTVVATSPVARTVTAPTDGTIAIDFDRPLDPATVDADSFWAFARWSGRVDGSITLANGNQRAVLTPATALSAGESVMVILSHDLRGLDGTFLRQAGYSFQFWTAARLAPLDLIEADRFSTRTSPGITSRAYGGFASDVDGDGALDLTIVNEDTNDLRVFLNHADTSATFAPFLIPTEPTGSVPSPNEPSDFDRDGHVDVAVANTTGSSVSILLGNGDGTFAPHQEVALGGLARGIAVLDLDGDGDVDVAATDRSNGGVRLLFNDGAGNFGAPTFVAGSNGDEWALGAADMDEDGVLDLVVGSNGGQTIEIFRGNGDGTLTSLGSSASGGGTWMLALGDLDGDGHEDVSAANSGSNNGAILLGDGNGGVGAPQTHPTDPFPLATDLGDLDGDGDLDWITASFSGDWRLFLNNGDGSFTFDRELAAPQAASCSLMFDADGDGALDLALIDELADEVLVLRNAVALFADGFESGDASSWN